MKFEDISDMPFETNRIGMRRSTHLYCRFCHMNLANYDQCRCDRCLIRLDSSTVTSANPETLPRLERLKYFLESTFNKCLSCMGREDSA